MCVNMNFWTMQGGGGGDTSYSHGCVLVRVGVEIRDYKYLYMILQYHTGKGLDRHQRQRIVQGAGTRHKVSGMNIQIPSHVGQVPSCNIAMSHRQKFVSCFFRPGVYRLLGVKDLTGTSTTGGGDIDDEIIIGDSDSTMGMSTTGSIDWRKNLDICHMVTRDPRRWCGRTCVSFQKRGWL